MLTPDEAPSRDEATLDDIGDAIGWDAQYDRAKEAARGLYRTVGAGTRTWRAAGCPLEPLPLTLPAWITSRGDQSR
jgi:hypothetical protein